MVRYDRVGFVVFKRWYFCSYLLLGPKPHPRPLLWHVEFVAVILQAAPNNMQVNQLAIT